MEILTFRFWMIKCLTHKLAEGYSEAAQLFCHMWRRCEKTSFSTKELLICLTAILNHFSPGSTTVKKKKKKKIYVTKNVLIIFLIIITDMFIFIVLLAERR